MSTLANRIFCSGLAWSSTPARTLIVSMHNKKLFFIVFKYLRIASLQMMSSTVSIKLEIHVASEKLRNFLVFCVNSITITLHKQNWTDT